MTTVGVQTMDRGWLCDVVKIIFFPLFLLKNKHEHVITCCLHLRAIIFVERSHNRVVFNVHINRRIDRRRFFRTVLCRILDV